MYLKEVEYMLKIAEEQNITRAAEKLFITPSALTQQLTRLESDLGVPLFHRDRRGCTPTEAGEIYLQAAREMMKLKKETYLRLQDLSARRQGKLTVGFPPDRGASAFTSIYPKFHREYPKISINIMETSVRRQHKLIASGDLDFGFVTLRESQKADLEYIPICQEELVLILPASHPLCREAQPSNGPYPTLDPALLKNESFAMIYRLSTIYQFVEEILHSAGVIPNVLFESPRTATIIDMVESNMCCGIIPDSAATRHPSSVAFFCLPGHPSWMLYACCRRGAYLSKASRRFIQLASHYWQNGKSPSPMA